MKKKEMIPLAKEEKKMHNKKNVCYTCKKVFSTDDDNKEKDDFHYTGKYRGAADNICNLRYKTPK